MERRIIVLGGLGNQMFLAAISLVLEKMGFKVSLDISLYQDFKIHNGFELEHAFITHYKKNVGGVFHRLYLRALLKYKITKFIIIDKGTSNINYLNKFSRYLFGYWQSDVYFSKYEEEIRKLFRFNKVDERNLNVAKNMERENSVSIHIRRGDYIGNAQYSGICTEEYYDAAINYMYDRLLKPHFYIFSNDPKYCELFMKKYGENYTIIDWNIGSESWKDMFLMSKCKCNIIANSSFSWWGAWLNMNNGKIVIAPSKYDNMDTDDFNKIRVPKSWIRL